MPLSPGPLTIPGPPLLGQPPEYAATGLGARLLTNGSLVSTGSFTAASVSPLASVVFVAVSVRTTPTASKILRMESSLGGPWLEIVTTAAGAADRRLSLWAGLGVSGSGTITGYFDVPPTAGRYTVFEFTGIDAANPWVAANVQLNNGTSLASSLTPNALQSGHNAYLACQWHNTTENVDPKLVPSEEIFDSNSASSDGHELNYYVGWNGGSMGGQWQTSSAYRAFGVEIAYDPASVPPPPVFPRRPETFPKATVSEVFDTFGPPILKQQEFVYTTGGAQSFTVSHAAAQASFLSGVHTLAHTRALTAQQVSFNGATLTAVKSKIVALTAAQASFLGGVHALKTVRALTAQQVSFNGGTHAAVKAKVVTHTAAAITFTGGSQIRKIVKAVTAAAVTFNGGTHAVLKAKTVQATAAQLSFLGAQASFRIVKALASGTITFSGGIHAPVLSGLSFGQPVRDPQAKLTGVLAESSLVSADGKAVLVSTNGQAVLVGTEGKAVLTETEGKADLL